MLSKPGKAACAVRSHLTDLAVDPVVFLVVGLPKIRLRETIFSYFCYGNWGASLRLWALGFEL